VIRQFLNVSHSLAKSAVAVRVFPTLAITWPQSLRFCDDDLIEAAKVHGIFSYTIQTATGSNCIKLTSD
jgi:hypothetical protein